MTLRALIRKRPPVALATATIATEGAESEGPLTKASRATATAATPATEQAGCRPRVATVANLVGVTPCREQGEFTSPDPNVVLESATPPPPLYPGWRVAYLDYQWRLAGGSEDPDHGTVDVCRWEDGAWMVRLTDGQRIPLRRIRSVGAVDHTGRCFGAWTVQGHGYDGQGPVEGGHDRAER